MSSFADQLAAERIPELANMRCVRQIAYRAFFKHNGRVFRRRWVGDVAGVQFELLSPSLNPSQIAQKIYKTCGEKAGTYVWTASELADAIKQSANGDEARFIAWPAAS